jgi:hypothetical protein
MSLIEQLKDKLQAFKETFQFRETIDDIISKLPPSELQNYYYDVITDTFILKDTIKQTINLNNLINTLLKLEVSQKYDIFYEKVDAYDLNKTYTLSQPYNRFTVVGYGFEAGGRVYGYYVAPDKSEVNFCASEIYSDDFIYNVRFYRWNLIRFFMTGADIGFKGAEFLIIFY